MLERQVGVVRAEHDDRSILSAVESEFENLEKGLSLLSDEISMLNDRLCYVSLLGEGAPGNDAKSDDQSASAILTRLRANTTEVFREVRRIQAMKDALQI